MWTCICTLTPCLGLFGDRLLKTLARKTKPLWKEKIFAFGNVLPFYLFYVIHMSIGMSQKIMLGVESTFTLS